MSSCMAYADLNPIRAGLKAALEASDFTGMRERTEDKKAANAIAAVARGPSSGLTATFSPSGEKGEVCVGLAMRVFGVR